MTDTIGSGSNLQKLTKILKQEWKDFQLCKENFSHVDVEQEVMVKLYKLFFL